MQVVVERGFMSRDKLTVDPVVFCRYACTSVALWSDLIIGAFGSGHIRIFSSLKGSLLAEVTAHAKWINAIDIAPATGKVCTSANTSHYLHEIWIVFTDTCY